MLGAIKDFLEKHISASGAESEADHAHRLQLATAVLLAEMSRMDPAGESVEQETIRHALTARFDLREEETEALMELARETAQETTSYYRFTALINDQFTAPEKVQLIETLWRVAFADGVLDKHEEYLVRKVSELIHVSHQDFIAAKLRAQGAGNG